MHGLGATDSYIAGRFAARATGLAMAGGIVGTVLSVPLLLALCHLAAPFAATDPAMLPVGDPVWPFSARAMIDTLDRVPLPLWIALPLLPVMAAVIGWGTAQATVRTWLRRLP